MSKYEKYEKQEEFKVHSKKTSAKKQSLNGANPATLKNVRIIQKHLVYVIGLSAGLALKETLSKIEYFGQYGSIMKVVVNKNRAYNPDGPHGPSFSAYISYVSSQEASLAILSVDNVEVDGHLIRASFGTTKYCTFFLKNCDCPNKECLYLHRMADEEDIICRDDMSTNKNIFHEQQLLAIKVADLYNQEIKKKLIAPKKYKSVLPSTEMLYEKEVVLENDPEGHYKKKRFNSDGYGGKFRKKYEYEDQESYYQDYPADEIEYILVKEDRYNKKNRSSKKTHNKKENFNHKLIKSEDDSHEKNTNPNSDNCQALSGGESNKESNNSPENNLIQNNKDLEVLDNKLENNCYEKFSLLKTDIKKGNVFNSPIIKNIYRKREISRFDFVNSKFLNKLETENRLTDTNCKSGISSNSTTSDVNTTCSEVPEFISNMLYKKISRYTFFKKFTCVKDLNTDIFYFEKELKNNNNSWAQFITSNVGCDYPCIKNNTFDFSNN